MMSRFVIALLFFLIVGFLAFKVGEPIKANNVTVDAQEKTWTEWALSDFNKESNPARIVIIGSSLVLTPINLADAQFHNSTVNGALHHKSDFLASLLKKRTDVETSNFNFALPGLMPSDAYLITKLFMTGKNHPDLLIYGVGPRDFVDNLLASPASTDPFRCLSKYLPANEKEQVVSLYKGKDWQSRMDYFVAEHFPLYGKRDELMAICTEQGQKLYQKANPIITGLHNGVGTKSKFTVADLHNLLPTYNPMAIDINQAIFQPNVKLDPDRFARNLDEYKARYRKPNWDTFTCQSSFFLDTLKIARDNNVKVLVVAMPITSVNRDLLPGYIFNLYKNNLRVLSKSFSADFLDLGSNPCFTDQDFGDTVHLSTSGSTKMVRLIADYVAQHNLYKLTSVNGPSIAQTGMKL